MTVMRFSDDCPRNWRAGDHTVATPVRALDRRPPAAPGAASAALGRRGHVYPEGGVPHPPVSDPRPTRLWGEVVSRTVQTGGVQDGPRLLLGPAPVDGVPAAVPYAGPKTHNSPPERPSRCPNL